MAINRRGALAAGLGLGMATTLAQAKPSTLAVETGPRWDTILRRFGHRNWIAVVDSAYPEQSKPGIQTILSDLDQLKTVEKVLASLDEAKHVRPNIYLDAELPHISERDARGIGMYRNQLKKLLGKRPVQSLLHEKIIDKLDKAAEKFNVLVIKTDMALPYTSVFIELECGYWSGAAEKRLREAIEKGTEKP